MTVLYGRTRRLTAKNGGFRPGQSELAHGQQSALLSQAGGGDDAGALTQLVTAQVRALLRAKLASEAIVRAAAAVDLCHCSPRSGQTARLDGLADEVLDTRKSVARAVASIEARSQSLSDELRSDLAEAAVHDCGAARRRPYYRPFYINFIVTPPCMCHQ
jgi:hypothetical protein